MCSYDFYFLVFNKMFQTHKVYCSFINEKKVFIRKASETKLADPISSQASTPLKLRNKRERGGVLLILGLRTKKVKCNQCLFNRLGEH